MQSLDKDGDIQIQQCLGPLEGQKESAAKPKVSSSAVAAEAPGFLAGCQMHTQMASLAPSPGCAQWGFQAHSNEGGIRCHLYHLLTFSPVLRLSLNKPLSPWGKVGGHGVAEARGWQ